MIASPACNRNRDQAEEPPPAGEECWSASRSSPPSRARTASARWQGPPSHRARSRATSARGGEPVLPDVRDYSRVLEHDPSAMRQEPLPVGDVRTRRTPNRGVSPASSANGSDPASSLWPRRQAGAPASGAIPNGESSPTRCAFRRKARWRSRADWRPRRGHRERAIAKFRAGRPDPPETATARSADAGIDEATGAASRGAAPRWRARISDSATPPARRERSLQLRRRGECGAGHPTVRRAAPPRHR